MHYMSVCLQKQCNLNGVADKAVKVKLRRVGRSWVRIFWENRAGLCKVTKGQGLKRLRKEQKVQFVQNTVSKAQGTMMRLS